MILLLHCCRLFVFFYIYCTVYRIKLNANLTNIEFCRISIELQSIKKIVLFNYQQSPENTPACETAERSVKVTGSSGCCLDIK